MQRSSEPTQTAAMEEWVLVGGSVSDRGSDMSFTTVQIGGNHRASDALDSSVDDLINGENEEEGESNGEYGYFDLDLPALAGSKAVFGASDDSFDLNLAASILSMGSVGYDDTAGIQGGRHLDDIDMDSFCAEDGDGIEHPERSACAHCANMDTDRSSDDAAQVVNYNDIDTGSSDLEESDYADDTEHSELGHTESSGVAAAAAADKEQPASCSRGRLLDDIDMENAVHELIYGNETMIRMQYLARARKDAAQAVSYNDIDTESSDAEESDYSDDGTESTDAEEESDYSEDGTESDDDDTESSDEEESDCSDDSTECADASGTTGGGNDARNSHIAAALQRLAAAREASLPPTAPHLFFPNAPLFIPRRAGASSTSTAASPPPCAPHLYFRNRAD